MGGRAGGGASGGMGSRSRDVGYRIHFQDINTGKEVTKISKGKTVSGAYKLAKKISDNSDSLIIKGVSEQRLKINLKDINTGKTVSRISKSKTVSGAYKLAKKISDNSDSLIIQGVSKIG